MRRWLGLALVALTASFAAAGAAAPEARAASATQAALGPDGLLLVPALGRIVDQPGVLTPADRASLEARLARFEADRGAQIAIVIVSTTGVEPIEDFANRVGSAWKIGRRGVGDGLLLVIATQDRKARIEVARSLEGAIPDAIAKRVIQQTMGPHFATGDYAGGLAAALDELMARIEQERLGLPATSAKAPAGLAAGAKEAPVHLHLLLPMLVIGVGLGLVLRRLLGAGGALVAGAGAGTLAAGVLASIALGALVGIVVFVFALVLGAAGRYGHALGGAYVPGSWGGGGGFGGGGGGGGGFSSGGGGDFSGGGASGNW